MATRSLLALFLVVWLTAPLPAASGWTQPRTTPGQVLVTTSAIDGSMRLAGVDVALHLEDGYVVAKTVTDMEGRVTFPDVPPGRYFVRGARPGFVPTDTLPFDVTTGEIAHVSLVLSLSFVAPNVDVTAPAQIPDIPQSVSSSDVLAGSVLDIAPLQGDDFQSLLPLLPGVVRGPDGRLRAKGGQPAQSALQISSTSLNDPTTGDFDLQLPGQSLETVELLANPFAAEYGRFSTSIVQIRTRRGTNAWEVQPGNLMPRFRNGFTRVRGFEPRLSVRGPLKTDRLFLAQDFQFRYLSDPVKSLPDEPSINLTSFDSFTRLDGVLSARHSLGMMLVMFPRRVEHLSMDTFRPPEVTPDFHQRGISVGIQDRFEWLPNVVLESTLAGRRFDTDVKAGDDSNRPMVYTPDTLRGTYFNDQKRDVNSLQWVQSLTVAADRWGGQHLFKVGLDVQHSVYDGSSVSRPVEMRRLDGSLAEQTIFGPGTRQRITATEFAAYAQDRWRVNGRITFEFGLRLDRDDVVEGVTASPRGGISLAVLPEGRAILRAGVGTFRQRTPLNVAAFEQFESRTVTRFDTNGAPASSVHFANVAAPHLRTPEAVATNIEWNQRFARRVLVKANYLQRAGTNEYVLGADSARGEFQLSSEGSSNYSEVEFTVRYLGGDRRDLTASYVHSRGTADLNSFDQFYGNVRTPIMYDKARGPIASDVPHRLLVRGTFGLPGAWTLVPILELRSGFPWSAVDEFQRFFAGRDQPGRLPMLKTLDLSLSRPWRIWRYRFTGGIRVYNALGSSAHRDVQNNIASPNFGRFFNPIERSIGFVIGAAR